MTAVLNDVQSNFSQIVSTLTIPDVAYGVAEFDDYADGGCTQCDGTIKYYEVANCRNLGSLTEVRIDIGGTLAVGEAYFYNGACYTVTKNIGVSGGATVVPSKYYGNCDQCNEDNNL